MKNKNNYDYLLSDLTKLNGVGKKTMEILKKKKVNNIFDLLWRLPKSYTDRTFVTKICDLQIGKVQTIRIVPLKYQFPRVRHLPNRVNCIDQSGKIDCIFFNSYEGYVRKILPLNEEVTINGKVNSYKGCYQITNPTYVSQDSSLVETVDNKYSLTEGITEKTYNKIIKQILQNLPILNEWHEKDVLKKFDNESWNNSIIKLHDPTNIENYKANFYKRLAYDEILASFLVNSEIRKKIKKIKKISKKFTKKAHNEIINKLNFDLTNDQEKTLNEINIDLNSKCKMFRLLQGDVGSGKTIVSLISALSVINSGFQVALMAPTEILARQHFILAKKLFPKNISIELLSSKSENIEKKKIIKELKSNKINMVFSTHAIFQKKIIFANLGYIIIDEQHKFGVRQRKLLSDKGGDNCDVLLMSATPIPRTLTMSVYGDMDVSIIKEKPSNRKEVKTYSKLENKIDDVIKFVKKEIKEGNQVFWVCPLIEESKKLDHQSSVKKYKFLNKIFPNDVALIHGKVANDEKEEILKKFLDKEYSILVSTTIIEVGIDFPNANVIIIENANKFGLSQLHQLRGRVGRGIKQASCILMFKSNLSANAKKRINILKNSNDGFEISEEDMKLRGFGDLLGFKQSGLKNFRLADPIQNEDLFLMAEKQIRKIEMENINIDKYKALLKLYDQADIINDMV
ncbi:ATP-dependent DNA helicase RecG [Candidatus Pelagibacter ubique]|uniref:Probable DNA 3'-5' helicase RecG n=1 Tax=Pelagibacter ubique TaxID=198252 RepID=A0ABX1T1P2_PELUQ|nr:ATP-dependent DNA helicase RecG [Candidatus Pelagibacter ubique]NMN68020.1 ATP-dependent DNA helicase RecG [Candidatus Pelagibacter ubique]